MRPTLLTFLAALAIAAPLTVRAQAAPVPTGTDDFGSRVYDPKDLTKTERQILQDGLIWSGQYYGLLDGGWGPMTQTALNNWRRGKGLPLVPLLTETDIAGLFVEMLQGRDAVNWTFHNDPVTNARIGYPAKHVVVRADPKEGVTHYVGQDVQMTVARISGDVADVRGILDVLLAEWRKEAAVTVSYRLDKPHRQVLSVDRGGRWTTYTRFDNMGDGRWSGFSLSVAASRNDLGRLIAETSATFDPTGRGVLGNSEDRPNLRIVLARAGAGSKPPPPPAMPPAASPQIAPVTSRPPTDDTNPSGSGTGFVVRRDGILVTNEHVVHACRRLALQTGEAVTVIAADSRRDIAVLRAARTFDSELSFRSDGNIDHGESVRSFGYPYYGMFSTNLNISEGIVTALSGIGDDPAKFQVSAAIQPGNSGGPLLDESGLVIGIAVSTMRTDKVTELTGVAPQNMNYGIRATLVQSMLLENGIVSRSAKADGRKDLREIARSVTPLVTPILCFGKPS